MSKLRLLHKFRLMNCFDKRFSLSDDVYLVTGTRSSAIYDLPTGDVYSVDSPFTRVLGLALAGRTPQEIVNQVDNVNLYGIIEFLAKLVEQGLGHWYQGQIRSAKSYRDLPIPPFDLRFAWLELTHNCNLYCIHCYTDSASQLVTGQRLSMDEWGYLTSELGRLGCSMIQLTGGEALMMNQLTDLILTSRDNGIETIEVFSNLTLLTGGLLEFFSRQRVMIATSLYGPSPQIHDSITRVRGSFQTTVRSIQQLVANGVSLRIGIVILPQNKDYIQETIQFAREELGVEQTEASRVLRAGRGCLIACDEVTPQRLAFPWVTKEAFVARMSGHSCWGGKICISPVGDVLPCPFTRDIALGNVRQQGVSAVISSDGLNEIWRLSKDKVETCRDCEYRYACFDCRPKAATLTGKPANCRYDPYQSRMIEPEM